MVGGKRSWTQRNEWPARLTVEKLWWLLLDWPYPEFSGVRAWRLPSLVSRVPESWVRVPLQNIFGGKARWTVNHEKRNGLHWQISLRNVVRGEVKGSQIDLGVQVLAEPFNTPMCILKPQKDRHSMQYSLKFVDYGIPQRCCVQYTKIPTQGSCCMLKSMCAVLCLPRVCGAVFIQRTCILVFVFREWSPFSNFPVGAL